jgi:hypothetical protein
VYDEDLTNLEEWCRRLKVEYDIYFNGHRKRPPDDLRIRVERVVKRLAEANDMSFTQRFRYNTLISRFYVYRDLWRRTQQERESPDDLKSPAATAAQAAHKDAQEVAPPQSVQVSIVDPAAEVEKVRQLYDELLRMRGDQAKDAPGISYQQFAEYIATKTQGIKNKQQCPSVLFRIALEGKTIKLTAKADNSSSG